MSTVTMLLLIAQRSTQLQTRTSKKKLHPILLLLIIPFIALCYPAWYDSADPEIAGIPFFYWYQLLWIVLTALILAVVYFVETAAA